MNNVIVVVCAIMAIAHAEDKILDYIKRSRDQYEGDLVRHNEELVKFYLYNEGRIEGMAYQNKLVCDSILQNSRYLTYLKGLNNVTHACTRKYEHHLPSLELTTEAINNCESNATHEFSTIFSSVTRLEDALESYIKVVFDTEIPNCGIGSSQANYMCVYSVISRANNFIHEKKVFFKYELVAARQRARANIEAFADCGYSVHNGILTRLGQHQILVEQCINAVNKCPVCSTQFSGEIISLL